jgi:hypothetical protein
MGDILKLLFFLLLLYLLASFSRCSKETFIPSSVPSMEIGSFEVQPGKNVITFNFQNSFPNIPFVKLQSLNTPQNSMDTNVYSLTVANITNKTCTISIKEVNGDESILKPFLIQYFALSDPNKNIIP